MKLHKFSLHNRQFLLGPRPIRPIDDWQSTEISDSLILSHCPRLRTNLVKDCDGRPWVLLGLAIQTDPLRPAPDEEIQYTSTEKVLTLYPNWSGRWILVGVGELHLDASGLLGCYFRFDDPHSCRGEFWVSSSLAILSDPANFEPPATSPRKLIPGVGFDWDPPPLTGFQGIRKLLPSQVLDLNTGRIRARPINITPASRPDYNSLLAEIGTRLTTALKNVAHNHKDLWIALTAGNDSRLLLAAAWKSRLPIKAFTQTYPEMSAGDRNIPPKLARIAGIEHIHVEPEQLDYSMVKLFDKHTAGQNVDRDRVFFASQQWAWAKPDSIILRGHVFAAAKCIYWSKFPSEQISSESILKILGADNSPDYVRASIREYIDLLKRHKESDVDWRDRFYLEVRLAGWASSQEQSLDLIEGTTLIPANSTSLLSLLWAIPVGERLHSKHHFDLIERLAPELLTVPINPPTNVFRKTILRVRKYYRISSEGGVGTAFHELYAALRRRM